MKKFPESKRTARTAKGARADAPGPGGAGKKRPKGNHRQVQKKLAFTFCFVTAVLFALGITLAVRAFGHEEDDKRKILSQQGYGTSVIAHRRGDILDRNYTVLAGGEEVYNLIIDPKVILYEPEDGAGPVNKNATLQALVTCYGYEREELEALLAEKAESSYVRYERRMSAEQRDLFLDYAEQYNTAKDEKGKRLHADVVKGVWFEPEYKRIYPYDGLGSLFIGFTSSDVTQGIGGIEQYYNEELTGIDGRSYSYINTDGVRETTTTPPTHGNRVVTTIDYTMQRIVEEEIRRFKEENEYANIGVVVMDPQTAEIYAMGSDKQYDLNNPRDLSPFYSESELGSMSAEDKSNALFTLWRGFPYNDAYVPGSVAKLLTVAGALEEGVIRANDKFLCDGGEEVLGVHVPCNKKEGHGELTLEEVLMYSCNDALIAIASKLGIKDFSTYQHLFSFGTASGLDLPGESDGILYTPEDMTALDLATSSFGQAFTVNMVQMAAACASVVNGGYYYQPHIVKQILNADGSLLKNIEPVLVRRTATKETTDIICEAMRKTVESGTGRPAAIAGYQVGGKTGTAQKNPVGSDKHVTSFLGTVPYKDPQLLVYVVIDEPGLVDGVVSGEGTMLLEKAIMERLLAYMGIPPAGAS